MNRSGSPDPAAFLCHQDMNIDQLQAGLFSLITQYVIRPCPHVAEKIVDHILFLYNHPYIDLLPAQRQVYAKLINHWRSRLSPHTCPSRRKLLH